MRMIYANFKEISTVHCHNSVTSEILLYALATIYSPSVVKFNDGSTTPNEIDPTLTSLPQVDAQDCCTCQNPLALYRHQ